MTKDETSDAVDTSRANINRMFDARKYRFGKDRELLGMIVALAGDRDELERLAGLLENDIRNLQGWTKELLLYRTGSPAQPAAYSDDDIRAGLHRSQDNLAMLTAYRSKNEGSQ